MPGGFGFTSQPQQPPPDPRKVGMQLAQRGQGGGMPAMPMPMPMAGEAGSDPDRLAREQGGAKMGGAGQRDTSSEDEHPSAFAAAVGEALTRMGNGLMVSRDPTVDRERRKRDVMRLGVSDYEAELLSLSGGI